MMVFILDRSVTVEARAIRVLCLLWLLASFSKGVTVAAMPNPSNAPSHLLMSSDELALYLFVPPIFSTNDRAEKAKLLAMRLGEGYSIGTENNNLFKDIGGSPESPLSLQATSAAWNSLMIPFLLPSTTNTTEKLLLLVGSSSCGSIATNRATIWEYLLPIEGDTNRNNDIRHWKRFATGIWPRVGNWGGTFVVKREKAYPEIFLFGGMCASSNASISSSIYSSSLASIYPDLSSPPLLPHYLNSPIGHAGFSITPLKPIPTYKHQYLLIGGHSSSGFVGLDKLAVFTYRESPSTSIDGEGEGGSWKYVSASFRIPGKDDHQQLSPRSGHASVLSADGSKIFVFGGWVGEAGANTMKIAEPQVIILDMASDTTWVWKTGNSTLPIGDSTDKTSGLFGHAAVLLDHEVIFIAGGYVFTNGAAVGVERNTQGFLYNITSDSFITRYRPFKKTFDIPPSLPPPIQDLTRGETPSAAKIRALAVIGAVIAGVLLVSGAIIFITWYRRKQSLQQESWHALHSHNSNQEISGGAIQQLGFPWSTSRSRSRSSASGSRKSKSPFSFKSGEDIISLLQLPTILREIYQPTPIRRGRIKSFSPILEVDGEDEAYLCGADVSPQGSLKPERADWRYGDLVKGLSRVGSRSRSFWTSSTPKDQVLNDGAIKGPVGVGNPEPIPRAPSTATTTSLNSTGSSFVNRISALLLPRRSSFTIPTPSPLSNWKSTSAKDGSDGFSTALLPLKPIGEEEGVFVGIDDHPGGSVESSPRQNSVTITPPSPTAARKYSVRALPLTPQNRNENWQTIRPVQAEPDTPSPPPLPHLAGLSNPLPSKPSKVLQPHIPPPVPPPSPSAYFRTHSPLRLSPIYSLSALPCSKSPSPSTIALAPVPAPPASPVYSDSIYSSTHTALSEFERHQSQAQDQQNVMGIDEDDISNTSTELKMDVHHFRRDPSRSGAHLEGGNSNLCSYVITPTSVGRENFEEGNRYPGVGFFAGGDVRRGGDRRGGKSGKGEVEAGAKRSAVIGGQWKPLIMHTNHSGGEGSNTKAPPQIYYPPASRSRFLPNTNASANTNTLPSVSTGPISREATSRSSSQSQPHSQSLPQTHKTPTLIVKKTKSVTFDMYPYVSGNTSQCKSIPVGRERAKTVGHTSTLAGNSSYLDSSFSGGGGDIAGERVNMDLEKELRELRDERRRKRAQGSSRKREVGGGGH